MIITIIFHIRSVIGYVTTLQDIVTKVVYYHAENIALHLLFFHSVTTPLAPGIVDSGSDVDETVTFGPQVCKL